MTHSDVQYMVNYKTLSVIDGNSMQFHEYLLITAQHNRPMIKTLTTPAIASKVGVQDFCKLFPIWFTQTPINRKLLMLVLKQSCF